ncbi:hypothetical protein [Arthrobacter zhaoguopingii]|uniref:hypothetical protein n=1 Tax=Arthrobacter zhaoguopingii TaxID=2681491 RepID=UPI00135AE0AB|nr:hypothetical protein [Arthrobacter zhaoguopingii]
MKPSVLNHRGKKRSTKRMVLAAAASALSVTIASSAAAADQSGELRFPSVITLPNDAIAGDLGYQPEGIAVRGATAYVGSFADGTVVTADLRTGQSRVLVEADGDPALGVEVTDRFVLVAGALSGEIRVYDRRSGHELAVYKVTDRGLVNDITVIAGTAYFTDSQRAVLYRLPLDRAELEAPTEIPLAGDFKLASPGPGVFNSNGIVAQDGHTVIVAQTTSPDGAGSALYAVDVATGHATRINITGGAIRGADGLVLKGNMLSVVQYDANSIAQLRLSTNGSEAEYRGTVTNDSVAVPTTADYGPGGALYNVNSRFGTLPSDSVSYEIVRIGR